MVSPGIVLIREMSLRLVKTDAERRAGRAGIYRGNGSSTEIVVPPLGGTSM